MSANIAPIIWVAASIAFMILGLHHAHKLLNTMRKPTQGNKALTAEQVKQLSEIMDKHWHNLSEEYGMPEASALPEYSYDWHAIADEFNAMIGAGGDAE